MDRPNENEELDVAQVGSVWIASFAPLEITMVGVTRQDAVEGVERARSAHSSLPIIETSEFAYCEACE
jgi:hypothetical protein